MEYSTLDARIKWPFNMQVCGPSQSGKSEWVAKLIYYKNNVMEGENCKQILWFTPHGHVPSIIHNYPNMFVYNCLPWQINDAHDLYKLKDTLLVLDDFALHTKNSAELTELFTRFSHHNNCSIIQITQNVFWAGSDARTRSLNVHYFVLLRQVRDQKQIRTLSRQISQNNTQFEWIMKAYNDATQQRYYGYLLVSCHPRDNPNIMLRTNIFPNEKPCIVYLDKNTIKTENTLPIEPL